MVPGGKGAASRVDRRLCFFPPRRNKGTLTRAASLLQSPPASGTSSYVLPWKQAGKGLEAGLPRSLPHPVSSGKHDSIWG